VGDAVVACGRVGIERDHAIGWPLSQPTPIEFNREPTQVDSFEHDWRRDYGHAMLTQIPLDIVKLIAERE
jgi:hypothetical protein